MVVDLLQVRETANGVASSPEPLVKQLECGVRLCRAKVTTFWTPVRTFAVDRGAPDWIGLQSTLCPYPPDYIVEVCSAALEVDCVGLSGDKQISDGLADARHRAGSVKPDLGQLSIVSPQLSHLSQHNLIVQVLGHICLSGDKRSVQHSTVCRIEVKVLVEAVVEARLNPVLCARGYEVLHDVVVTSAETRVPGAVGVVKARLVVNVCRPHAEPAAVLNRQHRVLGSHRHCRPDPLLHVEHVRIEGVRRREPLGVSANSDAKVLGVADVGEHGDHVEREEGAHLSLRPRQDVGRRYGGRSEVGIHVDAANYEQRSDTAGREATTHCGLQEDARVCGRSYNCCVGTHAQFCSDT